MPALSFCRRFAVGALAALPLTLFGVAPPRPSPDGVGHDPDAGESQRVTPNNTYVYAVRGFCNGTPAAYAYSPTKHVSATTSPTSFFGGPN